MFHQDATATPSTLRPTVRISNLLIENFHMNEAISAMSDTQDVDSRTPLLKQSVPRPASLSRKISLLLQDWWLWEILSALTALISSTVIIVILVIFDSSSLPDWPSVFTINSTISFFAVITKLAITSALGASISQSKWLWYRQEEPRPLKDLQLFEDASRGPWGALALLFSIRARHIAFVGATITVLMLLFDPFLQQVVVYPDRLVASDKTATIVRAQNYVARSEEGLPLPSVVDMSLKAAIYEGIFDVRDQADVNIEHYCSTGNCTWQDFSSLAVCSKCANITSYIERSCNETGCYHLYLPNGPTITGSGSQINSSTTNISPDLANTTASIIQFTSLISKSNASPSAYECALFYCINTYTASVTDGAMSQTITSTFLNNTATHSQSSDLLYTPPPSFTNNTTSNTTTFTVSSLAARALHSFITTSFTGHGQILPPSSNNTSAFSSDTIHALYSTTDYTSRITNLAISMTNNIRQQNSSGSSPHPGIAYKTETYVKVRWAWFAYPAAVVVLSVAYLVGTIVETTGRGVWIWKGSCLAMLGHGRGLWLGEEGVEGMGGGQGVGRVSEMGERLAGLKVELVGVGEGEEKEGWRFVER